MVIVRVRVAFRVAFVYHAMESPFRKKEREAKGR